MSLPFANAGQQVSVSVIISTNVNANLFSSCFGEEAEEGCFSPDLSTVSQPMRRWLEVYLALMHCERTPAAVCFF